jgi:hypothetical protein
MLSSCFEPIPWVNLSLLGPPDKSQLKPFATMAKISSALRLDFYQHFSFETMGRHLLYNYGNDIMEANEEIVREMAQC